MPSRVTSTTSAIPSPPQKSSTTQTSQQSTPQDIVDLSVNGAPNSGTSGLTTYQSYGPKTVRDQFKFDIENGRFGNNGRYTPLHSQFESVARSTYYSRAGIEGQVNAFSGKNSAQSALFTLGYLESSPNNTHASTHMDARTQQNRRIDRNLDLLHML
jgi:hypothetical protein